MGSALLMTCGLPFLSCQPTPQPSFCRQPFLAELCFRSDFSASMRKSTESRSSTLRLANSLHISLLNQFLQRGFRFFGVLGVDEDARGVAADGGAVDRGDVD